jgi:hypothetical protein
MAPDRMEIVSITLADRAGNETGTFAPILRDGDKARLGRWEIEGEIHSMPHMRLFDPPSTATH